MGKCHVRVQVYITYSELGAPVAKQDCPSERIGNLRNRVLLRLPWPAKSWESTSQQTGKQTIKMERLGIEGL